ncbi:MAG: hypothetical protein AB1564_05960 [Chloroflexota bacterium]
MTTYSTNPQTKPGMVMTLAIMTLVSGIINLLWGPGVIFGTFGVGLLCTPLLLLNLVLGAFEIAYAIKLLENPPQPVRPSQAIAIWEIVALVTFNIFSVVVGIVALIFYNDQAVKDYFARINVAQTPAPVEPLPALPAEPAPALSEVEGPVEPAAPRPEAAPVKPKRIRKVAKS